jgi:hypothetical protein
MIATLPPYEDIVASELIKNCFGSKCHHTWGAEVACMMEAMG